MEECPGGNGGEGRLTTGGGGRKRQLEAEGEKVRDATAGGFARKTRRRESKLQTCGNR